MSEKEIKVLLVEDSDSDSELLAENLKAGVRGRYSVTRAKKLAQGLELLGKGKYDIVLLDLNLPDSTGVQTIMAFNGNAQKVPIIILSGILDQKIALEALKQGAQDYVEKGEGVEALERAITYAAERKNILEKMRSARDETAEIIHKSPLMMIILDQDLRAVRINPAAEKLAGMSSAECEQLRPGDVIKCINSFKSGKGCATAPECEECPVKSGIIETFKSGVFVQKKEVRTRVKGRDEFLYFLFSTALVTVKNEKNVLLSLEDVTEIKRAQETAEKQRKQAQSYLDVAGALIMVVDFNGGIKLINKSGAKMLGFDNYMDVVGKNWIETFIPKNSRDDKRLLAKRLSTGDVSDTVEYENTIITRSGETKILLWHNALLRDEDGLINGFLCYGEDITGRKAMEQDLIESEAKYKALFNNSEIGMIISDADTGRFIEFNNKACEIFEADREQLAIVTTMSRWKDEKQRQEMRKKLFEDNFIDSFEMEVVTLKGNTRKLLGSFRYNKLKNQIESAIIDVTQIKEMQTKLLESEAQFRGAFDQIAVGFLFTGIDGKLIRVNNKLSEILGYSIDELQKTTVKDITHPDDFNKDLEALKKLINGKINVYKTEKRYFRKDGKIIWANITSAPVRDADGKIRYLVTVIEDVTSVKEAQERWTAFSDSVEELFVLYNRELKLTASNRANNEAFNKLSGKELALGKDAAELIRDLGQDPEERIKAYKEVLQTGKPYEIDEFSVRSQLGEERFFTLRAFPVSDMLGVIISDITELKRSEMVLKKSVEKLQETDKLKSNFLSMISHELRTPLTSIKGFLTFLDHGVAGDLNKEQREFVNIANANAGRLLRLINDLLDYSRIERGALIIDKKKADLIKTVEKAIILLRPILSAKQISLEVRYGIKEAVIMIDEDRVEEVLLNLIGNAVKFSHEKSKIDVYVEKVLPETLDIPEYADVVYYKNQDYIMISVTDSGPGIAKKELGKVFDRFYQTDSGDSKKKYGIGLGLSIAKYIIEEHDGCIWAESEGVNKSGAVFRLMLPLTETGRTACKYEAICGAYKYFGTKEGRDYYIKNYCEGEFEKCERLKRFKKGEEVPDNLMPDGEKIDEK